MAKIKEKRLLERITIPNLNGKVEIEGSQKGVYILDACEDGVCISGVDIPVGDVILLNIEHPEIDPEISLYAKSVWASDCGKKKKSGLSFLHTNKILFKQELTTFSQLIDSARAVA